MVGRGRTAEFFGRDKLGLLRLCAAIGMLLALVVPVSGVGAVAANGEGWEFHLGTCNGTTTLALGSYVNGPGVPPLGVGSYELTIMASGAGYPQVQNSDYDGTPLSDLTALSYSTFLLTTGPQTVAPMMILEIDQNDDGVLDDELAFQPAAQATVVVNHWQTWNAVAGNWWSLEGLNGMGTGTAGKPLSAYVEAYPNARIINVGQEGGLRLAAGCVGSGWASFDGAFDAVVVGVNNISTIYDFEADGVHVTNPTVGNEQPGLPAFMSLTPAPFSTVMPGDVRLAATVTSPSNITSVSMLLDGKSITPALSAPNTMNLVASSTQSLGAGTHTVTVAATNTENKTFTAQWDVVVSSNTGDNEWFYANGAPKTDQINATMKSLVQAFRWHLFGQSWDGQAHPEMPTHASTVSQGAPLSNWVTGTTFDEASTNATLTSLVQAFRWHFWGISWDGNAHPEMPTHANVVLPPQSISAWFNADGSPNQQAISATLQSLVQAFRWHFWGYSWDGQHHFTDMPTHGY
jgi:hypothetical protein